MGETKPAKPDNRRTMGTMDTPKRKQTLVEEGTEFNGTMKSTCSVVVNGTFDGQIDAPELSVAGTGAVLGTVKAAKLRSEGTLAGSIDAEEVYLSGTVRSNTKIRASKLEVKLSQEGGKLEVTFGSDSDSSTQRDAKNKGGPPPASKDGKPAESVDPKDAGRRSQSSTNA